MTETLATSRTKAPGYPFFSTLAKIINSGQSRSVMLYGNVYDLFFETDESKYSPLVPFICGKCDIPGIILMVYELNGPIRFTNVKDRDKVMNGWIAWQSGTDVDTLLFHGVGDRTKRDDYDRLKGEFERNCNDAVGRPTVAMEFMRQLAMVSRVERDEGQPFIKENLLIVIEAADMLVPTGAGDITRIAPGDRHRINIMHDWFSDPGFMHGEDSVIMLSESRGQLHPRIAGLPQMLSVEVPSPDAEDRGHFIDWYMAQCEYDKRRPQPKIWGTIEELAKMTAGLSIHALRQLLIGASHSGDTIEPDDIVHRVEEFISSQLGEDVVEFKKPNHTLDDVVGATKLVKFINDELLPRFKSTGEDALPGAAVAGAIGGGKTFIFEAAAGALGLPVLTLKNIRSQWYGQTDVIFERLRRLLEALGKVIIFVDEADTQFGAIGPNAHETERRLTGKIQQMMSDPKLRGKVVWLLMTARIHLLSADIRRPGRVGDLIIPVLDPEGEDRNTFIAWMLKPALGTEPDDETVKRFDELTKGYSAAAFASLRSNLKAQASREDDAKLSVEQVEAIVHDQIPPAIETTRRYQTLQALINCTRRSLLPDPDTTEEDRAAWHQEIRHLEAMGIQ